MPPRKNKQSKAVKTLKHDDASRKNIPTAEYQSVMADEEKQPIQVAYERRNRDLDPQLVWRGKDEQDWSDLVVNAPPLYIQEKVHPKVLVDDLLNQSQARTDSQQDSQLDMFADFNGVPDEAKGTEFYQHDAHWTNRMILGDSLQVMASLAEREGLRSKVQCIYIDPPYGIKFNSNFQWSTTSRDVKDGKTGQITREPEQVKAFRDTWRDGIHSYLTYLRDRLTVARDLLADSGSIFIQIGDENVHRIRALADEIFGDKNFCSLISFKKTSGLSQSFLPSTQDFLLWYAKDYEKVKFHQLYRDKLEEAKNDSHYSRDQDGRLVRLSDITGPFSNTPSCLYVVKVFGKEYSPSKGRQWKTTFPGMQRLVQSDRIVQSPRMIYYRRFADDFAVRLVDDTWHDISGSVQSRNDPKVYVVQTSTPTIQRCILMTTDPGDLILDPTCGSGTTAYVAEQWGRRWITIDTSRVALALARARIMGARYPYYLLKDSKVGQQKEAALTRTLTSETPTYDNIRQGFVYERVPRIILGGITNNSEIDTIWEQHHPAVEQALDDLNQALKKHPTPYKITNGGRDGKTIDFTKSGTIKLPSGEEVPNHALLEWEVPQDKPDDWPKPTEKLLKTFWNNRAALQKEIDASIAAKADQEFLYDKPYEDKSIVRVAGPFTVESLSPHRVLAVDENDELIDPNITKSHRSSEEKDFATVILETLKVAGVQQAHKEDKINFTSLTEWPGRYICAEGHYLEGDTEKRAGIFIGPEFGTVSRADLVATVCEAGEARFDVVIACAFNYDAQSADFTKLGRIPILKARMNADLHMADNLKNTGSGNLFVIFGEPDIDIEEVESNKIQVTIHGVDVFHPQSGEVHASTPDEIACWFIDTNYNEESFFVRHAYFLGASDPYKSLKTTLKAEIDADAWASLYGNTSRPFSKPKSGRIAVKVINHLGDEVMKVFSVN